MKKMGKRKSRLESLVDIEYTPGYGDIVELIEDHAPRAGYEWSLPAGQRCTVAQVIGDVVMIVPHNCGHETIVDASELMLIRVAKEEEEDEEAPDEPGFDQFVRTARNYYSGDDVELPFVKQLLIMVDRVIDDGARDD